MYWLVVTNVRSVLGITLFRCDGDPGRFERVIGRVTLLQTAVLQVVGHFLIGDWAVDAQLGHCVVGQLDTASTSAAAVGYTPLPENLTRPHEDMRHDG